MPIWHAHNAKALFTAPTEIKMASKPKAERAENDAEIGRPKMLLYGAVPCDNNHDGYDCEFVEPPPEAVQTECPVCLLILKEPCLISCCGHKFCRVCVERVKKDKKPCPLCSEPDFSFMQERSLERFLKGLQVWCSYKKDGCEWEGKLEELEQHLNQTPSPENRLNGCQFVAVECTHECEEWFQRHHITSHETEQCKKRPYSCDYCRDYHSTFKEVTEIHYPQCSKYPVACPNECHVYKFERQELESHLRDQCPLTLVDCPFHYAGCQTQLPRKDMPEHMRETVTHLTLLASVTQNLVKENQELRQTTAELQETIAEQQQTIAELQQNTAELQQSHDKLQVIEQGVQALEEKNQKLQQTTAELRRIGPWCMGKHQVTNEEVQALKEKSQQLQLTGEGNLRTLQWMNQQYHDKLQAIEKELQTLKTKNHRLQQQRETTEEMHSNKIMKVVDEKLQENNKKYQVLQLMQQALVGEIQTLTESAHKLRLDLTQLSGFPIDFRVERTNDDVYSPAFYTHPHGYRMCVCVYPNGCGVGKGTHVSIFTYMMQGPFDDHLKWPFRGEITIQIVNQAGDHDHIENTIPYDDKTPDISAGRVTNRERSGGWGVHQILAHTALPYNAIKKTLYLKDNYLIVRVVKVK